MSDILSGPLLASGDELGGWEMHLDADGTYWTYWFGGGTASIEHLGPDPLTISDVITEPCAEF